MTTRFFCNGLQGTKDSVRALFARFALAQGYTSQEVRDIWDQACEPAGEEFRDVLLEFGVEIQITH